MHHPKCGLISCPLSSLLLIKHSISSQLLASLASGGNSASGSSLAAPSMSQSNGHTSNVPMPSAIQSAYGLALPASTNPNNYTATYPSYPSIPANNYQSHTNSLSGASDSLNLANATYSALTNPINHVAGFGAQLRTQLSASTPVVPSSLYPSMADQAQLSRSTPAAADLSTPASGLSPAILSLLSQASANNALATRSSDPSGVDAPKNTYTLPSASSYDQSASAPAASVSAIPTGPRAMQAYATSSNGNASRPGQLSASLGVSSGTTRGAVTTPSLPTLATSTDSNSQSTTATAAASQAAVQQLLVLLVSYQ